MMHNDVTFDSGSRITIFLFFKNRQYFCFTFEIEGLLREFVAFLMKRLHDCTLQSTDLVF